MASRFPLIADSSSNSLKEIPAGDHVVFDAAAGNITTLTDGSAIGIDFSDGNNFKVTLAGNRTLSNPTNVVAGQSGFIAVTQDGTGGRTLAYSANYQFVGGTPPILSTAASSVDILAWYAHTTTDIVIEAISNVQHA